VEQKDGKEREKLKKKHSRLAKFNGEFSKNKSKLILLNV